MWKRGIKLTKIGPRGEKKSNDYLIMEIRRSLKVNDVFVKEVCLLPKLEQEWARGYAAVHNLSIADITIEDGEINIKTNTRKPSSSAATTASVAPVPSVTVASPETAIALMSIFQELSLLYKDTAMTHSVGLSYIPQITEGPDEASAFDLDIPFFSEELHAENALYKCIGLWLNSGNELINTLITSEKITSLDVELCDRLGITTIISRFAVTDRAYDVASSKKITLYGFARGLNINKY